MFCLHDSTVLLYSNDVHVCVRVKCLSLVSEQQGDIVICGLKLLRNRREGNNELTKEVTYIPGLGGCACVTSGQWHSFALSAL